MKNEEDILNKKIDFRLTQYEFEKCKEICNDNNIKLSEMMRELVNAVIPPKQEIK